MRWTPWPPRPCYAAARRRGRQGPTSQRMRTVSSAALSTVNARRGDPRRPGERQREALDDHRDVVRVGEPAVRPRPDERRPRQHDDPRRPPLAEGGDAPPAQRVRGHRHRQHGPAERRDERPVREQRLGHAAGDQRHVQHDHHGEVAEAVLHAPAREQALGVPRGHDQLRDPLAGDDAEQHPVDGHAVTTAAARARR